MRTPSYHTGFAPRDFAPRYPQLWTQQLGMWCPSLGPTGATLRDWSGRAKHGTLNNMVLNTTWTNDSGYALSGNGTNSYVEVLDFGGLLNGLSKLTTSLWFKQRVLDVDDFLLFASCTTAGNSINVETYTDGGMYLVIGTGPGAYGLIADYSLHVTANTWTHLALVFDGSLTGNANRLKCYINGRQVTIDTYGGTIGASLGTWVSSDVLYIGNAASAGNALDGLEDDIQFHASAFTQAEIAQLYSGGQGRGIAYTMRERRRARSVAGGMLLQLRRMCA